MKVLHTTRPFVGRVELPPFGTVVIFQPDEMWMVEAMIGRFLQMELTDESRIMLEQIYERVRRPHREEIN